MRFQYFDSAGAKAEMLAYEARRQRGICRGASDTMVQLLPEFRDDAGATAAFVRSYEHLLKAPFDKRYAPMDWRKFIPVNTEVGPSKDTIVARGYDFSGSAKLVVDPLGDLPEVAFIGDEVRYPVRMTGVQFSYTVQDLLKASEGLDLSVKKPQAARFAMEVSWRAIALFGAAFAGLTGAFNSPNVPVMLAPGTLNGGWMTGATPDQILADMNAIANQVTTQSLGTWRADTMLLPQDLYLYVAALPFSTLTGESVLTQFLKNRPDITKVDYSLELGDAASVGGVSLLPNGTLSAPAGAGTGGTNRIFCYNRSPEVLEFFSVREFTQEAPEKASLLFRVPCYGLLAGTVVHYPQGCVYADGC